MNIETGISTYLAGINGEVKPATMRNLTKTLNLLARTFPGRELDAITADELTAWRNTLGVMPSSANKYMQRVQGCWRWLRSRRHTTSIEPDLVRPLKTGPVRRVRFDPLLLPGIVAAPLPRDRAFLAVATELLLRGGELAALRVGDVLPGHLRVMVEKQDGTFDEDEMAISPDLQDRLADYLRDYRRAAGLIDADAFLFPRVDRRLVGVESRYVIRPGSPIAHPEEIIKAALRRVGVEVPTGSGVHAIRRTCARLLYDYLVDEAGSDRALAHVSSLLHHESRRTTELYLGVKGDRVLRNKMVRNGGATPLLLATARVDEPEGSVSAITHLSPTATDGV